MKSKLPISNLFNYSKLKSLLSFGVKGYLAEIGWFRSYKSSPVDEHGQPIPWVTYSFIDFIKPRINSSHSIFEYGSGNSTWFYAAKAGSVLSVEHDESWYEKIKSRAPENAELIFCKLEKGGEYCKMPLNTGKTFDMIIVDGRDRVNCCIQGIAALSAKGVMVLDDSERESYREAVEFLQDKGFRYLSFSGISPGLFYRKSTSVFYRADNCLGI